MEDKDLFHGKNTDTKEWIEGNFVNLQGRHFIISPFDSVANIKPISVYACSVKQWTGKTLIKGNKIYQGTIAFSEEELEEGIDKRTYFVCEWIEEWCMFAWLTGAEYFLYQNGGVSNLSAIDYWTYPIENSEKYHYAGDLYDNPELLDNDSN